MLLDSIPQIIETCIQLLTSLVAALPDIIMAIVEAIHVMQESMDIAGTTAKEAEATISGSVNALKSAVSNLIVGFGLSLIHI